jgi:hypothetical protein
MQVIDYCTHPPNLWLHNKPFLDLIDSTWDTSEAVRMHGELFVRADTNCQKDVHCNEEFKQDPPPTALSPLGKVSCAHMHIWMRGGRVHLLKNVRHCWMSIGQSKFKICIYAQDTLTSLLVWWNTTLSSHGPAYDEVCWFGSICCVHKASYHFQTWNTPFSRQVSSLYFCQSKVLVSFSYRATLFLTWEPGLFTDSLIRVYIYIYYSICHEQ